MSFKVLDNEFLRILLSCLAFDAACGEAGDDAALEEEYDDDEGDGDDDAGGHDGGVGDDAGVGSAEGGDGVGDGGDVGVAVGELAGEEVFVPDGEEYEDCGGE